MKIVVSEFKKLSPFTSLFYAENKIAKMVLALAEKKYFDNADLYVLEKAGFKIVSKKTSHK